MNFDILQRIQILSLQISFVSKIRLVLSHGSRLTFGFMARPQKCSFFPSISISLTPTMATWRQQNGHRSLVWMELEITENWWGQDKDKSYSSCTVSYSKPRPLVRQHARAYLYVKTHWLYPGISMYLISHLRVHAVLLMPRTTNASVSILQELVCHPKHAAHLNELIVITDTGLQLAQKGKNKSTTIIYTGLRKDLLVHVSLQFA